MNEQKPLTWILNPKAQQTVPSPAAEQVLPLSSFHMARKFHRQLPGYRMSPLKALPHLAAMLGVGGIWVKDESQRMSLNSFKIMGGSFAVYRFLNEKFGIPGHDLTYKALISPEMHAKISHITFTSATDGNHGRGLAWAAQQLGCPCVIYVHKDTSQARIDAIAKSGAEVRVVQGNYDAAVRQCSQDAAANGWQVISDTSWDGYEEVPAWVMQGYTTMYQEAQEQFLAQGITKPTHVFVQAGVGALAAATIGFYHQLFGADQPICVVVEPSEAACLYESAKAADGEPHTVHGELNTIMAGLACGEPSPLAWKVLWDCANAFVACPDYVAAKGMRVYAVPLDGDPLVISGESGAVTLGALMFIMEYPNAHALRDSLGLGPDSQVLLINTEGNTDPEYFRRVAWEGVLPVPAEYHWLPTWREGS